MQAPSLDHLNHSLDYLDGSKFTKSTKILTVVFSKQMNPTSATFHRIFVRRSFLKVKYQTIKDNNSFVLPFAGSKLEEAGLGYSAPSLASFYGSTTIDRWEILASVKIFPPLPLSTIQTGIDNPAFLQSQKQRHQDTFPGTWNICAKLRTRPQNSQHIHSSSLADL